MIKILEFIPTRVGQQFLFSLGGVNKKQFSFNVSKEDQKIKSKLITVAIWVRMTLSAK